MATYKPDHSGIGMFLHSPELDAALKHAGNDVIDLAREPLGVGKEDWFNDQGPDLRIRKYSRETRLVGNNHPAAAAREFGSGPKSIGASAGKPRPQGGYNEPTRALGKAGARIGDLHGDAK